MNKILSILSITLSLITLCVFAYTYNNIPKFSYVKADVIFNDFKMTKELRAKLENTQSLRKNILDSLLVNIKLYTSTSADRRELEMLQKEYVMKKEMFESQNDELSSKYNEEVWTRINQYVKDYSASKGYDYIFMVNAGNTLLYGSTKFDISDEVLNSINKAYDDKH